MLNLWTTFCQTMRYPRLTMHLLLWGTDAVRRVSHQSSTQPDMGCDVRRGYLCVGSLVELFFFLEFVPTWLQFLKTWLQFMPNWVDLAIIGSYRPSIETAETDQNGRNRPKSAWNHVGTAEIGFEWDPNILNLSFFNFILNICCFFCVFFFVLWIKTIVMCFLRIF